jgi:hypothetical protein
LRGEPGAKILNDFIGKKRDLTLEVILMAEVAIVLDPLSGDATNFSHFVGRVLSGGASVMADVVVPA